MGSKYQLCPLLHVKTSEVLGGAAEEFVYIWEHRRRLFTRPRESPTSRACLCQMATGSGLGRDYDGENLGGLFYTSRRLPFMVVLATTWFSLASHFYFLRAVALRTSGTSSAKLGERRE